MRSIAVLYSFTAFLAGIHIGLTARSCRTFASDPSDIHTADRAAVEKLHKADIEATLTQEPSAVSALWSEDGVNLQTPGAPTVGINALKESYREIPVRASGVHSFEVFAGLQGDSIRRRLGHRGGRCQCYVQNVHKGRPDYCSTKTRARAETPERRIMEIRSGRPKITGGMSQFLPRRQLFLSDDSVPGRIPADGERANRRGMCHGRRSLHNSFRFEWLLRL